MLVEEYLKHSKNLTQVAENGVRLLLQTKAFVPRLECPMTSNLWIWIEKAALFLNKHFTNEVVSDLVNYTYYEPDYASEYLKGVLRCLPRCTSAAQPVEELEKRMTELTKKVIYSIGNVTAHQDEATKFAKQMSVVSQRMSSFRAIHVIQFNLCVQGNQGVCNNLQWE